MTPVINGVPPPRVTVHQSVRPSVSSSLPLSITQTGVRLEQSGVLPSIYNPSVGKEQGMMTDNMGSRRIHTCTHTHTYTHTVCRIYNELHLHFRQQKNAYANADNADSNQRAPLPRPHHLFPLHIFVSRSSSVFFSLSVSPSQPFPILFDSVTFSLLTQTARQLITVYLLSS